MVEQKMPNNEPRKSWFSWLGIRKQKEEQINVISQFVTLFSTLSSMIDKVDTQWGDIRAWSDVLSNRETGENTPSLIEKGKRKGMMETYNKKWIALSLAIDFKSPNNPAFDRRAHNSPGFIRYGGRIFYDDSLEEIKAPNRDKNPYPAISSRGMGMYIPELTQRDVDDITKARDYLGRFLRDTGETLTGPKDAYKGISSLGEEETAQEGGK